jgi:predicted  nucleic acid-binding Zn-ribbon protein
MNKTLLLIIVDFLFLNLIALTRWEKAEPVHPNKPPVPQVAANDTSSPDQDLVEVMKQSLADEQATRAQINQQLKSSQAALQQRDQNLSQLQSEKTQLASTLGETQQKAQTLAQQYAAASQDATMTREQLAALQKELEARRAEAEKQKQDLAALTKSQAEARQKIEDLNVAVKVSEQEKQLLRETADSLKTQVEAEREERQKVQATTTQLAQGVGQLAQNSGELTQEIRANTPINANTLFDTFLANRVPTTFTISRPVLFGSGQSSNQAHTLLVQDGAQVYAIVHVNDTPFDFGPQRPGIDWQKISVTFSKPPYAGTAPSLSFLALDPRIIAIPVDQAQVAALGVKVYQTALDPFKFPNAVLISDGGKGYGEVPFKLDPSTPGYVKMDSHFFKRLAGAFSPSTGDLVLSETGELLGIMVNDSYCAVVNNFLPAKTITTGDNLAAQQTGEILNTLIARVGSMPYRLQ